MALKGLLTTVSLVALAALPAPTTIVIEPEQPATVAAIEETAPPIVEEQPVEAPAPEVVVFNAADRSTWPACAEGEIVRADNGQCAVKYVPPEPTKVAAKATPQKTTQAAIAPVAGGFSSSGTCDDWIAAAGIAEPASARELIRRESGCNPNAVNKSSGACGVAQELPCNKSGCGLGNGACQVRWMNSYVISRYGSWSAAIAFHNANNWY